MNTLGVRIALDTFVFGSTNAPVDQVRASIGLSWAREHGLYDVALKMLLAKRREHQRWLTVQQRQWQTKVSRRPQRGHHHDSWQIRESYVRCHDTVQTHFPTLEGT